MAGKYGTDYTGFGAYEGGVNSDKGANLVSTNSDGETSLLFGPAALREIQAGVANGDFAIPPDNATAAITDENPLPYWTISGDTSVVATVESSTTAASGNVLQFLCLTPGSPSRSIKRYIPVPGALDRSFSFYFEVYLNSYSAGRLRIRHDWVTADLTTTGTGGNSGYYTSGSSLLTTGGVAPSDAAYMYVEIEATGAAGLVSLQISEARVNLGKQALYITDSDPTVTPVKMVSTSGNLTITPSKGISLPNNTLSQYDRGGSADTTTITTAGTYYALTNAEASFTPQFIGQRWLLTYTGYASLNTTTIQYAFVRADVTDSSNAQIAVLGYGRADNFGQSGRGATVAVSKVWVADSTSARKFKLYGTAQTTNGLTLSLAYTQMTAYPIG
jgi:hypothetical protein